MSGTTKLADLAPLYGLGPTEFVKKLNSIGLAFGSHQATVDQIGALKIDAALGAIGIAPVSESVEFKGAEDSKSEFKGPKWAKPDERIEWDAVREALVPWKGSLDKFLSRVFQNDADVFESVSGARREDALRQLLGLSNGEVCYYDSPVLPLLYMSWYQVSRIHDVLALVHAAYQRALRARAKEFRVVDLGSGLGAVSWALVALRRSYAARGHTSLPCIVQEIDSSPFMVGHADRIWRALSQDPKLVAGITRTSQITAWPRATFTAGGAEAFTLVTMGFLFDHGDHAHLDETKRALSHVVRANQASAVAAVTSLGKADIAHKIVATVEGSDVPLDDRGVWNGSLSALGGARRSVSSLFPSAVRGLLVNDPSVGQPAPVVLRWVDESAWILPHGEGNSIRLSAKQHAAAKASLLPGEDSERSLTPVLVLGSAGSGKTLVIVERLMRCINRRTLFLEHERYLVTSFNRDAVDLVGRLLVDRLNAAGIKFERSIAKEGEWSVRVVDPRRTSTEVIGLNIDKVPRRAFNGEPRAVCLRQRWIRFAQEVGMPEWCKPEFLYDEYRRVIYRLDQRTRDAYLETPRSGRGTALSKQRRMEVWDTIMRICRAILIHKDQDAASVIGAGVVYPDGVGETFTEWRRWAADDASSPNQTFDAILVDESQDFMEPGYRLLSKLLPPHGRNRMAIFGDPTQGLWYGASSQPAPSARIFGKSGAMFRESSDEGQNKWTLMGSYRMPAAITAACAPLARKIRELHNAAGAGSEDDLAPRSRKAGTVGARPVVVYAEDPSELHLKLLGVLDCYSDHLEAGLDGKVRRVIVPEDQGMLEALGSQVQGARVQTIKGQERSLVIWSASEELPDMTEPLESIYTIVTRAVSVLVIAAGPEIPETTMEALRLLDRKHLLAWDEATSAWMNSW